MGKRRGVAKHLLGQLKRIAENNRADFIAGDFDSAAYRERGQAGSSYIEEDWEDALMCLPQAAFQC